MTICYQDLRLVSLHFAIILYIYASLLRLWLENVSRIAEPSCFMQETFALCKLDGCWMLLILVTREQNQVINFLWSVGRIVQSHTYVRNNRADLIWHTLKVQNDLEKRIHRMLLYSKSLSLFETILITFLILFVFGVAYYTLKKLRLNDNDILITISMAV